MVTVWRPVVVDEDSVYLKSKLLTDDGGEAERMQKWRRKKQVMTITNLAHAGRTASGVLPSNFAAIPETIAINGIDEGRRFRGKVKRMRSLRKVEIPWVSYYLSDTPM